MSPYDDPGHTVLAVAVEPLQDYVRARTAHYDAAYLSSDPTFGQAHVTLLAPWVRRPSRSELDRVAAVLAGHRAFDVVLADVRVFPDGIVHARTHPDLPLRALTGSLATEFPEHPPYGGRFGEDVVPHVTLDALGPGVTVESVAADVAGLLPARCPVRTVQLQWWQAGDCHVMHEWALSGAEEER